jgi:hypothetical protein
MSDVYSAFYEFSSLIESKVCSGMLIQTNLESSIHIIEDSDLFSCTCNRKDIMPCYTKVKNTSNSVFHCFMDHLNVL